MRTEEIIQAEKKYILQTYGRPEFVLERGNGVYLFDTEGNRYLDFVSGLAVNALGYGDYDVVRAIEEQVGMLMHVSNLYHTMPSVKLAELLVENSFSDRIFFCNSGTESWEAALKFCRKWGNTKFEIPKNICRLYNLTKSRLIQTEKSDLTVFANYRNLTFEDPAIKDEPSLNSRILYNDRYWDQLVQVTTAYETTSGTIAQQEFTYIEVEPGQGVYMWNDYNDNGIQELQEFEIAPFPDQAKYVRVFLPNQVFVRTHQNKFSQSLTLNPNQWQNETGFKKFLSYFYNQSSYLIDRKIERSGGNFDLNPFSSAEKNLLGITSSIRNSLFYNRGKQDHSVIYTFIKSRAKNLLTVGSQENISSSHQLQYAHLLKQTWLFSLNGQTINTETYSENYGSRNYEIESYLAGPKISYIFSRNASWDVFYEYESKENRIGDAETLYQQRLGTSFNYASEKQFTASGEFSYYKNDFTGNPLSPAAFQMLEGLQAGENLTWRLLLQKNLTSFLDVNINYQGRKSETAKAIHTGSVQLRAYF